MIKNIFLRGLSFFSVTATLISLTACASGTVNDTAPSNKQSESIAKTAAETDHLDSMPKTDFGGGSFTIIGVDYPTRRNFPTDDEAGEIVNDALALRNSQIEEIYNVKITCVPQAAAADLTGIVKKSALAGDAVYDLIISDIASSLSLLMKDKLLYDLGSLPYLNLGAPWWSAGMYENTSINGAQYITMGDISPMKYYAPYCLAYNRDLAVTYGCDDLYKKVLEGEWTLDAFDSVIKDADHDLDGDSKLTASDFYGYAHIASNITACAHYTGSGEKLSETMSDGGVAVKLDTDRSVSVIKRLAQVLKRSPGYAHNDTITMFMESRAMFYGNSYSNIIANFRDMKDNFSVIPTPKYDESQESYYSYINTYCLGGVGVPTTCRDTELTGLITEALCYVSYTDVRPALYETVMKVKVARDDESAKILDIIFNNTYIDLNGIFEFGKSATVVSDAILSSKEFSSSYAAVTDSIKADITALLDIYKS